MQAACKVASWEASVQKGTFNDASSGVCVVSSNADGAEVAVERGRERVAFSSAVEKALLRVTFRVTVERRRELVTFRVAVDNA